MILTLVKPGLIKAGSPLSHGKHTMGNMNSHKLEYLRLNSGYPFCVFCENGRKKNIILEMTVYCWNPSAGVNVAKILCSSCDVTVMDVVCVRDDVRLLFHLTFYHIVNWVIKVCYASLWNRIVNACVCLCLGLCFCMCVCVCVWIMFKIYFANTAYR